MSEQAYLVLLALAEEPRHGYGVVQAVRALSDDRVRLGAGTLYGILDRLVDAGYAEPSEEVVVDGRARRYYRLTGDGLDAVQAETRRLAALSRRARQVLGRPALGGA
ncbi:helix-turn-helix transcriptional regulator [Cellulomonas fimi]|nr:helix-turn-helix transcriptional regulator [Cellulomonas fimi]